MASRPIKRDSRELPPDFSELMKKLLEQAASFIQQFDSSEPEMRKIVEEFQQLSRKIKRMQKVTDITRTAGAVVGGVGVGVGVGFLIVMAPLTGGLSLLPAGAAAAAATAAVGGAVVVGANIKKLLSEKGGAEKVEKWGEEFIALVEPMKENLEKIKTTCESLEEKAAQALAENTQADLEEFQRILKQVSELKEKSEGAVIESLSVLEKMGEIVMLILSVIRVTSTPEEDEKLGNTIIQSAGQCEKVVDEFNEMKNKLREFRGH